MFALIMITLVLAPNITYQSAIIRNETVRYATFVKAYAGKKLSITPIAIFSSFSLSTCGKNCLWNELCKSFNYHSGDKLCELLHKDRFTTETVSAFQLSSGWNYYDAAVPVLLVGERCKRENPCYPCSCVGNGEDEPTCHCNLPATHPYIYMPLRPTTGKDATEYIRGVDHNGNKQIQLQNGNYITNDQFGKGKVLYIGSLTPQTFGNFDGTPFKAPTYGDYSLSFWMRSSAQMFQGNSLFEIFRLGDTTGLHVQAEKTSLRAIIRSISQKYEAEVSSLSPGWHHYWNHIMITWKRNNVAKIYLNGSESNPSKKNQKFSKSPSFYLLTKSFGFYLSEIAAWKIRLEKEEVLNIFEQGKHLNKAEPSVSTCEEAQQQGFINTKGYYWLNGSCYMCHLGTGEGCWDIGEGEDSVGFSKVSAGTVVSRSECVLTCLNLGSRYNGAIKKTIGDTDTCYCIANMIGRDADTNYVTCWIR